MTRPTRFDGFVPVHLPGHGQPMRSRGFASPAGSGRLRAMQSIRARVLAVLAVSLISLALGAGVARADEASARYKQGLAFKEQGKIDEAIEAFEETVKLKPDHAMAWASLGHLYKQKGQFDK